MSSILAFLLAVSTVLLLVFQVAVYEEYSNKLNRETIELCKKYDAANASPRCQRLIKE